MDEKKSPARKKVAVEPVPVRAPSALSVEGDGKPPYGHPDYEFPKEVHNLLVTAQTTHVELSAMADSKASILMGATFVVFTLTIGEITSSKATVPLVLLTIFSFLATVMSVLAVRPTILKPPRKPGPKTNLLFFGGFAGMPEQDYVDHMIEQLKTEEGVYRMMARDLHQNGSFLQAKKYRYLSYAYTLFLAGMVSTFVAFTAEQIIKALAGS